MGSSRLRSADFARAVSEIVQIYRHYRLPKRYRRAFDLITAPFVLYAGAGAIGTVVHYGLLLTIVEGLAANASVATVVGATAGALINYVLNYHVTFASRRTHRQTLPRFATVAIVGIVINGLGMELLHGQADFHYLASQVACTASVLALGFLLNRAWTFAE